MLADIFDPVDRGIAVAVFAAATFIGPVAGPVVGGFITMSYLGWRWTEYITAIMAFFFSTLGYLIIPETFEPVLLEWRAKKLRHKTKIWGIHAKAEETPANPKNIAEKYLLRPFLMLFLEPILLLITLYMVGQPLIPGTKYLLSTGLHLWLPISLLYGLPRCI